MAESKKTKKETKTENFDIKDIYTPLSVAKKEIWKRWNDPVLRKKVEDFLGGDIPEVFKDGPKASLVRHVVSPNKEFFYFADLVKNMGIDPCYIEYPSDKFVSKNKIKYYLCKLFFYSGLGRKLGDKINTLKIINFNDSEGKKFNDLITLWGENFVDFHHRIAHSFNPHIKFFDISSWLKKSGMKADKFYTQYLTLFVCHGILFENFLQLKEEKEFTQKIVLPSIKKIEDIFGIKPLIVPLEPEEDADNLYWCYYNSEIKNILDINKNK